MRSLPLVRILTLREGEYVRWKGRYDYKEFFTNTNVIAAFEEHIGALLNHRNALTGIAYKDDPTIMAWEHCNVCGLGAYADFMKDPQPYLRWIDTIGSYIKSVDKNHLYVDNSSFALFNPKALDAQTTDIVTAEYYPHWDALFGTGQKTTAATFSNHAAAVTAKGKVYVVVEYGCALAQELGARNIRVNSPSPGLVSAEEGHAAGLTGGNMERYVVRHTPFGRIGQPADIASVAAFLASGELAWLNGHSGRWRIQTVSTTTPS